MKLYKHHDRLPFIYPDDWDVEFEDGIITFQKREAPIGALQFSVFYTPENDPVTPKEFLTDYLKDHYSTYSVLDDGQNVYTDYLLEENGLWKYWAIKKENMMIFGTYNCDENDRGIEDIIVNGIIGSI